MAANIPTWVANRILGFFNRVQSIDEIVNGPIKDDPSDGAGRTIGPTLAARILRERNNLRWRRFREFEEFDAIPGVGEGTLKDLVYSFGTSAAQAFQDRMYNDNIIFRENWPLEYFQTTFDDQKAFNELVNDEIAMRAWIVAKVKEIAIEREVEEKKIDEMANVLSSAYIDSYSNSTPAAGYALALWFYEFDADNWFSWERIQEPTTAYFSHHDGYPWEMELKFFKGFNQLGIIRPGITPDDLPVVVNWPERAITLWFSALYD